MSDHHMKPDSTGLFSRDTHTAVVKRLQALGYPDDRIAKATGLTLREVRRILADT